METQYLDCKGMRCPLPIVEISKSMKKIEVNEFLKVEANDPVFLADVKAWCKRTENELVEHSENDNVVTVLIKKLK